MENSRKPLANPSVSLREEFDDWAVLYDPDTGHAFGLSPSGVYVWKLLDGGHSIDEMLSALRQDALEVPEEAGEQILAFVEELTRQGLTGCNPDEVHDDRGRLTPCPTGVCENAPDGGAEASQFKKGTKLRYERPRLEPLMPESFAHGNNCWSGSGASGAGYTYGCQGTGTSATGGTDACYTGIGASSASSSSCYTNGSGATQGSSSYACAYTGSSGGGCNPTGNLA